MRSRISAPVLLAAVAVAAASLISTGVHYKFLLPPGPPPAHASLPPSPASYLGVYEARGAVQLPARRGVRHRRRGSSRTWSAITAAGRSRSRKAFAEQAHAHGAIPFVQIDPTVALVSQIAGRRSYDIYLRTYADSVRDFGHAVVIGFGHEMNAPRYPWGYGHVRPAVFIAAWRHIVTVFHAQGADNVTWLWTVNQDAPRHRAGRWTGGRAPATSPGSASTATTSVRPTRSPASSAAPFPRCGSSPKSRSCCPRPRSGPAPASSPRSATCSRDAPVQDARPGVVRQGPGRRAPPPGLAHREQRLGQAAFRLGISTLTLARPSR